MSTSVIERKSQTRQPRWVKRKRRDPWWFTLARILVFQVIAVLFVEFALFCAGLGEEEIFKLDPVLGSAHLTNKRVTWRSEGYSVSWFNEEGMREQGVTIAKPADTFRIALLGDSLTESLQVPLEKTFGKVLERKLSGTLHKNVQVLNFGVSGYSTAQEYILLKSKVLRYKPDVVLVCYNSRDSFENWSPPDEVITNVRPFALHLPGGNLTIDTSPVTNWMKTPRAKFLQRCEWLRQNSRLWGLFAAVELDWSMHNETYKHIILLVTRPGKGFKQIYKNLRAELNKWIPGTHSQPTSVGASNSAISPVLPPQDAQTADRGTSGSTAPAIASAKHSQELAAANIQGGEKGVKPESTQALSTEDAKSTVNASTAITPTEQQPAASQERTEEVKPRSSDDTLEGKTTPPVDESKSDSKSEVLLKQKLVMEPPQLKSINSKATANSTDSNSQAKSDPVPVVGDHRATSTHDGVNPRTPKTNIQTKTTADKAMSTHDASLAKTNSQQKTTTDKAVSAHDSSLAKAPPQLKPTIDKAVSAHNSSLAKTNSQLKSTADKAVSAHNSSLSKTPPQQKPTIDKAVSAHDSSLAKAPPQLKSTTDKALSAHDSSLAKTPPQQKPTIDKAVSVHDSSLAKTPPQQKFTTDKAVSAHDSSLAKTPPQQKPTIDKAVSAHDSSLAKTNSQLKSTTDKAVSAHNSSLAKAPPQMKPTTDKADSAHNSSPAKAPPQLKSTTDKAVSAHDSSLAKTPTQQKPTTDKALSEQSSESTDSAAQNTGEGLQSKEPTAQKLVQQKTRPVYQQFIMRSMGSLLEEMAKETAAVGGKFAVVALPVRSALCPAAGIDTAFNDFTYNDEILMLNEICTDKSIPLFDLEKPAEAFETQSKKDMFYSVHLTALGHDYVGELLATFLDAFLPKSR